MDLRRKEEGGTYACVRCPIEPRAIHVCCSLAVCLCRQKRRRSDLTKDFLGRRQERVKEAALGLIGDSFSEAEDGGREEKGEGI